MLFSLAHDALADEDALELSICIISIPWGLLVSQGPVSAKVRFSGALAFRQLEPMRQRAGHTTTSLLPAST